MIEVFKTNVNEPLQAALLVDNIHRTFEGYSANFDLDDCDNILRVASASGEVHTGAVIALLEDSGFVAEVLPDETPVNAN